MKLCIGTKNIGKQKDFANALWYFSKNEELELLFPQDLGITEDVSETGSTFKENSLIKARYYFEKSGIPTISDDGGIIIKALNNEPGVKSRRWLGKEASDKELIDYTLRRMSEFPIAKDRRAVFVTVLTYVNGDHMTQCKGETEGYIAKKPYKKMPRSGLPFRALFKIHGKYYDELTEEEHRKYNHRYKAVKLLLKTLKSKNK